MGLQIDKVERNGNDVRIVGAGEANAPIVVRDSNGTIIGNGTTNAQGEFEIIVTCPPGNEPIQVQVGEDITEVRT
jgi:hypothetical protein